MCDFSRWCNAFILKKQDNTNSFKFLGLCVIEIKTKSALTTINDLEKNIAQDGSNFNVCNVGTAKFKELVK